MASIIDVQFEHYHAPNTFGVEESTPRLSWKTQCPGPFKQTAYEVELTRHYPAGDKSASSTAKVSLPDTRLVAWPFTPLKSRERISIRVRNWDADANQSPWSQPATLEVGLLHRSDWACERIAAPWAPKTKGPTAEDLFRTTFQSKDAVKQARLYITAQGVYEAELNGRRIGDYFMAPGWTSYHGRLQYQTYDVTASIVNGLNCLGVRVAEGWFCGRIGFAGGNRDIWGPHTALLAQLEIVYENGETTTVVSDASWLVTKGPIRLAEIYDGEKYDAVREIENWSSPSNEADLKTWQPALVMAPLPESVQLTSGYSEPVRRIETISPVKLLKSPSGKTIIDFGQNLVGYVRLKATGKLHQPLVLRHAEVLENGELATRPLRICAATDEYPPSTNHDPRFTFHGFRYVEISPPVDSLDVEAVVCHTDMKAVGSFTCSEPLLNQLYRNVVWGMRGNFLSVPTDCPQRDERLGWSGDLALFVPTATLIYDCFGMLKNWLVDVAYDQKVLDGVPPMVSPNSTLPDPVWCRRVPCAIWHDVTVLAPWELYQETGDTQILWQQWESMMTWIKVLPRNKTGATHLWDTAVFQLGDWLDPAAPPDQPWKGATDSKMVANMFLVQSLGLMARISSILGNSDEATHLGAEYAATRAEFHAEYVTPTGRLVSDSQAAYALAICLDLLSPAQTMRAGTRLVELVRKNGFRVGTGFAGTPYLCEALAQTGHVQVAYAMLLETSCPSWLYPVTMGATTMWERWDSMLPDGSVNPGEMTSFNHYAFGAIAKFLYQRVAGLQRIEAGWKRFRVAPAMGAEFSSASASHVSPYGTISSSWETKAVGEKERIELTLTVPQGTTAEVVLPEDKGVRRQIVGPGDWTLESTFVREYEWPVLPLKAKS